MCQLSSMHNVVVYGLLWWQPAPQQPLQVSKFGQCATRDAWKPHLATPVTIIYCILGIIQCTCYCITSIPDSCIFRVHLELGRHSSRHESFRVCLMFRSRKLQLLLWRTRTGFLISWFPCVLHFVETGRSFA